MRRTRRFTKPALGFLAAALALIFVFGGIAKAHVTVQPPEAEQGSFTKLTFRVPNELPDASTTGLRVQMPQDSPFASVSVKPKSGWTAETTEAPLATPTTNDDGETITTFVSEIAWSGGEIKPGEFDEFEVSVGPLPEDATELAFPTIQIYSNGTQVAWIDKPTASGEEGEHPEPTVELTAASGTDDHAATATATTVTSSSEQAASSTSDDSDDSAKGLAIVAIVIGGLAIIIAIVAIAMSRKKPTSSA
jgi:uncharacterized protein YcnI